MDNLLKTIENKPYERMAKLEKEKMKLITDQSKDAFIKLEMRIG
jgi:hypothetical protein